MKQRRRRPPASGRNFRYGVRVAAVATVLATAIYVALVASLDFLVSDRLSSQVGAQVSAGLQAGLTAASRQGATPHSIVAIESPGDPHSGLGIYGAPVFLWQLDPSGAVAAAGPGAPRLVAGPWAYRSGSQTVSIAGQSFAVVVGSDRSGRLVAGESLAELVHLRGVLLDTEALAFPGLLALVFLGALAIATRAVLPVEEARRRQLAFTADASHELRTPLSVLEAEVSLARSSPRDAAHYEQVLARVAHETGRLTRIVEDLLWLARFDAQPPPPRAEPIDLGTIADACRARFDAVAQTRSIDLSTVQPPEPVRIAAPPEWIERLAGVLVDNACRYAPEGGTVRIVVATEGSQAVLAVEDDGPGIPQLARPFLFDRFRRATDAPGGHGLGLSIADSVVRGTSGRWNVGTAGIGGARMAVTWPRA